MTNDERNPKLEGGLLGLAAVSVETGRGGARRGARCFVPSGTLENCPAIHRWGDHRRASESRQGRLNATAQGVPERGFLSSLTGLISSNGTVPSDESLGYSLSPFGLGDRRCSPSPRTSPAGSGRNGFSFGAKPSLLIGQGRCSFDAHPGIASKPAILELPETVVTYSLSRRERVRVRGNRSFTTRPAGVFHRLLRTPDAPLLCSPVPDSDFGLRICFGFRFSDFGFHQP